MSTACFPPDAHVQLLHGTVYERSPQGPSHAAAIRLVTRLLRERCPAGYWGDSQLPLKLGMDGEPEPDVALVPGEPRDYTAAHPTTARLVVEVADTSLAFDRTVKAGIYARADIPAYWIVNLSEQAVEVYMEPERGGYSTVQRYRPNESVPFDEAEPIPVASMLPEGGFGERRLLHHTRTPYSRRMRLATTSLCTSLGPS